MTGNTVKLLDALMDFKWKEALWGLTMLAAYVGGGALYQAVVLQTSNDKDKVKDAVVDSNHRTCRALNTVARLSLLIFGMADVVHFGWLQPRLGPLSQWRLPILSLGFGLINAASTNLLGGVTNAITGHWTKIGLGLTETLLLRLQQNKTTLPQLQQLQHQSSAAVSFSTSAWGLTTFVTCLVSTSVLLRAMESQSFSWLSWNRLPPMGFTLGLVYAALLTGYSHYLKETTPQSSAAAEP